MTKKPRSAADKAAKFPCPLADCDEVFAGYPEGYNRRFDHVHEAHDVPYVHVSRMAGWAYGKPASQTTDYVWDVYDETRPNPKPPIRKTMKIRGERRRLR